MPRWITTHNGNKIDLDWLNTDKDFNTAIRDYFLTTKLKAINVNDKRVYAALNKAYNERDGRYKKSICDVFFIPTRIPVDGRYEFEYNYYVTGRTGNGAVKIYDIIPETEIEQYQSFVNDIWGI